MKIVTVNIPESYLDSIEKLVGEEGLYPSRSELIRVAVRDFLLRELKMADTMAKYKEEELEEPDDKEYVRVPIERLDEKDEPVREFKTYKIIKRLDDIELPKEKIKTKRGSKKRKPLGNPFWTNKLDENGNLIRVPKN